VPDPATPTIPDDEATEIYQALDTEAWWEQTDYLPEDQRPPRPEPWTPSDRSSAEWAMAIVRRDTLAIARHEHDRDAWLQRINDAHSAAVAPLVERRARLVAALERYALAWHEQDPRVNKTLHVPSGEVKTTTPRTPKVSITDAAAVVAWLESIDPEVVTQDVLKRTDPEPMISGVRKLVTAVEKDGGWIVVDPASGERVAGLRAELGDTTATVKPDTTTL
jgi:hypothetical protein